MQTKLAALSAIAFVFSAVACDRPAPTAEPPRPVRTLTVAPSSANTPLVQTGEVAARRTTELGFPVEGRVAERLVDVGSVVRKGEPLARLDGTLLQNDARSAEAELASATASLELATATLSRQEQLFSAQSVSAQQMDEARAAVRAASSRRDATAAAARNATQRASYTTLVAPEDGVVTAVEVNLGQFVGPATTVVRLASNEREAVFDVAESVVATAPPDVKVKVSLASDPTVTADGSVRELSPAADPATRTYRVRVALANPSPRFTLGAPVRGQVELPSEPAIIVPNSATTSEGDSLAVYVVDSATHRLVRRVVTGSRIDGENLIVTKGLAPGERVVRAGVAKLRPGQEVALQEEKSP